MRIVILSDTHLVVGHGLDVLGPACAALLATADLVLHSGDVVVPQHLDWCEQFAPLLCARGNNDHGFDDPRMSPVVVIEREGWRIGVVHDVEAVPPTVRTVSDLKRTVYRDLALDILVAGDSHHERLAYKDGTLLLDSGSPNLPHLQSDRLGSMGLLEITRDGVHAEIVHLGETPGRPNPATPAHVDVNHAGILSASIGGVAVSPQDGEMSWLPRKAPRFPI
jgi:putative phosphoesterase